MVTSLPVFDLGDAKLSLSPRKETLDREAHDESKDERRKDEYDIRVRGTEHLDLEITCGNVRVGAEVEMKAETSAVNTMLGST